VTTADNAGLTSLTSSVASVDNLAATLAGLEGMTVFAPTNAAFSAATIDNVQATLEYHVVADVAYSTDLGATQDFVTVEGRKIRVTLSEGAVSVNSDSSVTIADVLIENGVVHVVDSVLDLDDAVSPAAVVSTVLSFVSTIVAIVGVLLQM